MTQVAVPDPRTELEVLLTSQCPLVLVETREERRATEVVRAAALRVHQARGWPVFQWTLTDGLLRTDLEMGGPQTTLAEPEALLRRLKATTTAGIYVLLDFHPFLDNPLHIRLIKDIAQGYETAPRTLVFVSHELKLPAELEHLAARLPLELPAKPERQLIVARVIQEWSDLHRGKAPKVDPLAAAALAENLAGLTATDALRLARQAVFNDGALGMSDVEAVQARKYRLLNRNGVLSYEPDAAAFADVGGMKRLRAWLQKRRPAFEAGAPKHDAQKHDAHRLDAPKGVLLLGVQGCGKSLAAKACAALLQVPLLRLDVATIFSKWHGESEKNLRESLTAAESLAPCVLWIDEIEKAFAAGDHDGGTTRRVLGSFLTWLAEKKSRVFVVATANDISSLPAELIRKGRFDEIFFVDLPDAAARAEIFRIHTRRRSIDLNDAELAALAARAAGFTGAEIEQAVVSAAYHVHGRDTPLDARAIARELERTRPLSVVMAEKVAALRAWAADRTVAAD